MWFRRILALLTLAILASSGASAQLQPALNKIPWNKYTAARITNSYQTIIGRAGTNLFAGSSTAGGTSAFQFPAPTYFPIDFTFIGVNYPVGSTTPRAVASGYLAFNGSGSGGGTPNLDYSTGNISRLIAPYWSDVRPSGVSEGGIYWRVDGVAGGRILTIEWRVQGVAAPTQNPGNFQVQLFEGSNKIEFHYGPNSIDRSRVRGTAGAFIGLKKFGFRNEFHEITEPDDDKFLLLTPPDRVRDTISLTRTRHYGYTWLAGQGTEWFSENYASWTFGGFGNVIASGPIAEGTLGQPSMFFHYGFPTLEGIGNGFRMTPVDNDVAAISASFAPARTGNAYNLGSSITVSGSFVNIGANARQNIPVQMDVYRLGNPTLLATRYDTVFRSVTPQFGTDSITFSPPIGPPTTSSYGTYIVKIYPKLTSPMDQDLSNDTLTATFYISYPDDVAGMDVLQPVTYTPSFPQIYPVGFAVPVEGRFVNLGTNTQSNVPVGFAIYTSVGQEIYKDVNGIVRGNWEPLELRDVTFAGWTPTQPGTYYIRIFTILQNDQQITNDTFPRSGLGKPFSVQYEIEIETQSASAPGSSPIPQGILGSNYPVGRPIDVAIGFRNNGFTDATNVPATVRIANCATGQIVYNRQQSVVNVPGDNSLIFHNFPKFIPLTPGTYCLTAWATDAQDPIRGNDTTRWSFTVQPGLSGTIQVGLGERFRTFQEAADSLQHYGLSGPVIFELVDDVFIVRPTNNDPSNPAYDFRGNVFGSGPQNTVLWRAVAGKDSVRIVLKSPSGIGLMFGQGGSRLGDTSNPGGYMTFDGGPDKKLSFVLDTAGTILPSRAIPFFFSSGSSNYGVKNSYIYPADLSIGRKQNISFQLPAYSITFNTFTYVRDLSPALMTSAGIFLRNTAPQDQNGNNPQINGRSRDTLRNQNNVFDGNVISNFGFGILSVGAGPLYRVGNPVNQLFEEYSNTSNQYVNNEIYDVGRAGIAVSFEKNSTISQNLIEGVLNDDIAYEHAVGIWASAGGQSGLDTVKNRGYSTGLLIERNRVTNISSRNGNAAGIWLETGENVFTSQTSVFRFPAGAATNHRVWNNMAWSYAAQNINTPGGVSVGVALSVAQATRPDIVLSGNRVENNTIYNLIAGSAQEYGIAVVRHATVIRNNIIAIQSPSTTNPIALGISMPDYRQTIISDYNVFQVDSGFIGALSNLSSGGLNIPSPPVARTLNQWRALTGLDSHSIQGIVSTDFVNTTPGSENLHIRPGILGSIASNRGVPVAGLNNDIDGDPRAAGGNLNAPDAGADEFSGALRNRDLLAEDFLAPFGYRATAGQFSDAEYVMTDSLVPIVARLRNLGGLPQTSNSVTLTVERFNGSVWSSAQPNVTRTTSFPVASTRDINFGTFQPATLRELGQNDAFYGTDPNVTPLYRFTIRSGNDDFNGNNVYTKTVRFYVQRATREVIVSVENFTGVMPADAIGKSNKLNADTLLGALDSINWERANGVGLEDFDLFQRDKWPVTNLNFKPWVSVIWAQGAEPQGLEPEERVALKAMLDSRNMYQRSNLIIAGQDVARIHDVMLTSTNGQVSDQDFVENYLRANYLGNTVPTIYSGRHIRGVIITPGKYEKIDVTGVAGDNPPQPSLLRVTVGSGIARATHNYTEQTILRQDSAAGVASASTGRNVIYYAIDWRHYARFAFEPDRSGAQRLLLSAIDFIDEYEGVLPIKLVSFEAFQSGRSEKAVTVEWTTANEEQVAGLEIERAVVERTEQGERVSEFALVERQTPRGTTSTGASYRINDRNVEYGVEYRYRLVTVGLDGQRTVDAQRSVKVLGGAEAASYSLNVAPNPVSSIATIALRAPEGVKISVELHDVTGRLVRNLVDGAEGGATIELNVENLASGVYVVRYQTSTGVTLNERITVQK